MRALADQIDAVMGADLEGQLASRHLGDLGVDLDGHAGRRRRSVADVDMGAERAFASGSSLTQVKVVDDPKTDGTVLRSSQRNLRVESGARLVLRVIEQ